MGHVDRRLGRAITVMQLSSGQLLQHPVAQLCRQGFAARKQPTHTGTLLRQRLIDKQMQQGRHKVQRGHTELLHQLRDTLRVTVLARPGQHQSAACDQRPEALPH